MDPYIWSQAMGAAEVPTTADGGGVEEDCDADLDEDEVFWRVGDLDRDLDCERDRLLPLPLDLERDREREAERERDLPRRRSRERDLDRDRRRRDCADEVFRSRADRPSKLLLASSTRRRPPANGIPGASARAFAVSRMS